LLPSKINSHHAYVHAGLSTATFEAVTILRGQKQPLKTHKAEDIDRELISQIEKRVHQHHAGQTAEGGA
jgi:hypothetical protein